MVQLDSDMLCMKNMDELMEMELDPAEMGGKGSRVMAASHACTCNPLKKPHYPKNWIPENCAFTSQHAHPKEAQTQGAPATAGLGMPNGGLQVVNPSKSTFDLIASCLSDTTATLNFEFADQSLLAELFPNRWVPIPYVYNALKTMRREGVHDAIWRDDEVKNVHYILSPKPWDEDQDVVNEKDGCHEWWKVINRERLAEEKKAGIHDGF